MFSCSLYFLSLTAWLFYLTPKAVDQQTSSIFANAASVAAAAATAAPVPGVAPDACLRATPMHFQIFRHCFYLQLYVREKAP